MLCPAQPSVLGEKPTTRAVSVATGVVDAAFTVTVLVPSQGFTCESLETVTRGIPLPLAPVPVTAAAPPNCATLALSAPAEVTSASFPPCEMIARPLPTCSCARGAGAAGAISHSSSPIQHDLARSCFMFQKRRHFCLCGLILLGSNAVHRQECLCYSIANPKNCFHFEACLRAPVKSRRPRKMPSCTACCCSK